MPTEIVPDARRAPQNPLAAPAIPAPTADDMGLDLVASLPVIERFNRRNGIVVYEMPADPRHGVSVSTFKAGCSSETPDKNQAHQDAHSLSAAILAAPPAIRRMVAAEAENAKLRGITQDLTQRLNAALERAGRLGAELAETQD